MLGAVSLLGSTTMNFQVYNNKQLSSQTFGSFIHQSEKILSVKKKKCSRKQGKLRRLVIVNIGGQYEESFEDVKTQILNYFTKKAVRTVMTQLYEMNPPQYTWLYNFLVTNKPEDGQLFLRKLGKKCDHGEIYKYISDENLELMRERLLDTIVWPSDDTNTDQVG